MMQDNTTPNYKALYSLPVIVAALGYFVDIYDLLLFGIVRLPSLKALGLTEEEVSVVGGRILSYQQAGLIVGGILWGVLGDKRGRLSVLFGSIITYSLANIACGFVQDASTYTLLRFVAGVGLAGELGAGITLVAEVLPRQLRGYGSSIVAGVGLWGAVAAYFTVQWFDWRPAYFVGGGMGLMLLLLRISVFESGMFSQLKDQKHISRGNFFSFFTDRSRLVRYVQCIGIALPIWFSIGILATFSNEFGKALGIQEAIVPGRMIMFCYTGLALGDLSSGLVSQWFKSRKKAVLLLMSITLLTNVTFLYAGISSANLLYLNGFLMGCAIGYWAMFMTIAAEQFGTNLRATATTTVPNMVRGTVILMVAGFQALKPSVEVIGAAAVVGIICFLISYASLFTMKESFGRDLNFLEE
jgi:MFS family permease